TSAFGPSADLGTSSPGRTSRSTKVPGATSWSAATYEPRLPPSSTSTRLTSLWVTGGPGTKLAAAAYMGTVSPAAATTLATMTIDSSTRTTPATSRVSPHDGVRRRAAVGLGSSVMSIPLSIPLSIPGRSPTARERPSTLAVRGLTSIGESPWIHHGASDLIGHPQPRATQPHAYQGKWPVHGPPWVSSTTSDLCGRQLLKRVPGAFRAPRR